MSTCADCGEIIDVRCAHRLLQSERAKREETERQFQAKVAEIGALRDTTTHALMRWSDAVCRESKSVEDACNQARAERAKREEAERERDDAISELCKAGESIGAERARSAALMAELQFVADRTHEDESPLDDDDTALLHARALIVLSQSPTEKKT